MIKAENSSLKFAQHRHSTLSGKNLFPQFCYIFIRCDGIKPVLQSTPVHPLWQLQTKPPGLLIQIPPLPHGFIVLHSSTSEEIK